MVGWLNDASTPVRPALPLGSHEVVRVSPPKGGGGRVKVGVTSSVEGHSPCPADRWSPPRADRGFHSKNQKKTRHTPGLRRWILDWLGLNPHRRLRFHRSQGLSLPFILKVSPSPIQSPMVSLTLRPNLNCPGTTRRSGAWFGAFAPNHGARA